MKGDVVMNIINRKRLLTTVPVWCWWIADKLDIKHRKKLERAMEEFREAMKRV